MSDPSNVPAPRRLLPWGMAVLGAVLIAAATVGLGGLFRLLTLLGLNVGNGLDAIAGLIIIAMVVVGLCLLIAGLVLALARAHARWLIGSGLALLCLGSGPLFVIIVAAKLGLTRDPNPNPVLEGMLAGFTFIPAIVLLICGLVALARRRHRSA